MVEQCVRCGNTKWDKKVENDWLMDKDGIMDKKVEGNNNNY